MLVYRAMIPSDDGAPAVGEDRNMLGLRPGEKDLAVCGCQLGLGAVGKRTHVGVEPACMRPR